MKLYELFEKLPFETLPHLSTSAYYRYTYDILRHVKPEADSGNIWVSLPSDKKNIADIKIGLISFARSAHLC